MAASPRNVSVIVLTVAILLSGCHVFGSKRSVLPSQRALVRMSPEELEKLVLSVTPIGMSRADVETALSEEFRRKWTVSHESVGNMSKRGFHPPVTEGDTCLKSEFAAVSSGLLMAKVATIRFLFNRDGRLKSVAADVWFDGP